MSGRGVCYDNACAESFFHPLKGEAIQGTPTPPREELRRAVFEYLSEDSSGNPPRGGRNASSLRARSDRGATPEPSCVPDGVHSTDRRRTPAPQGSFPTGSEPSSKE